jgi:hypothetical protein
MVVAKKATAPFVRLVIDCREPNKYIEIPQAYIPHVKREIEKAAGWRVFIDLDMTNSFHQIPLHPDTQSKLAVKTPWGNYQPRFLPEGVGPASGVLQYYVMEIFKGFDWMIVIFDNFLILGSDFQDLFEKLKMVIERANQHDLVLKFAKSWLGFRKVSFFGYEIENGRYGLGAARKEAVMKVEFPISTKGMQRFLGMALYFKPFVVNYSELAASLNDMIHAKFDWTPSTWTKDYKQSFEVFKSALVQCISLTFPNYELPWILRADSSQIACGAVLFQILRTSDEKGGGNAQEQIIGIASMKFSDQARRWDINKKEAFVLVYAVKQFEYLLQAKELILETDHKNLVWMEKSESAIVVRWRLFLQNFNLKVRHIPGKENVAADTLSRQFVALVYPEKPEDGTPEFFLKQCHGQLNLHFGVRKTYQRLNMLFPGHKISYEVVADFVARCPTCQKTRLGMVDGIKATPRNLKVESFHSRVCVDHLGVSPTDKYGHCCLIVVVVSFTGFIKTYPAKDYSADTLARSLFSFYCTYGMFKEIASDPGSAMMAETVKKLHDYLGMHHRVSIVDRPESNGVERHNKEVLRHLGAYVHDQRVKDTWGEPHNLLLIDLEMNSQFNEETGVVPLHAMFGSRDSDFFKLPEKEQIARRSGDFVGVIDESLRLIREVIRATAQRKVEMRLVKGLKGLPNEYQKGDFVLFDKWPPGSLKPTKLTARFMGPYEVLRTIKNDVECKHMATGVVETFFVERLKIFHGNKVTAREAALRDQDQYVLERIVAFRGDVERRKHVQFLTLYADKTEVWNPLSRDLEQTRAFEEFCQSRPDLRRLLMTKVQERKFLNDIRRKKVDELKFFWTDGDDQKDYYQVPIQPGVKCFVDLKTWSDPSLTWYYGLGFEEPDKILRVVEGVYGAWVGSNHLQINVEFPVFGETMICDSYWVYAYGWRIQLPQDAVLVDHEFLVKYPKVLKR